MSQSVASYGNAAGEQDKTSTRSSVANKNEIKISADGIAKLTFNFIDELHGDSSLEPGEVKTPPQSPGPVTMSASHNVKLMVGQSSKSQRDAEACQAKVRAILELDAIKRREEADIKKQRRLQKITEGPSSEAEEDAEKKRLEKKERKRLKKLKKEKKAAVIIDSDDEDDEGLAIPKKKKKLGEEYEPEEEEEQHGGDMRSVGGRFNMINAGPPHLPQPFPENFMGFHPMNPFMRGPRPEFHMQRGVGFHMRGRGGIRGARFPGFRPPFIHGLPRQHTPMLRDPNPLPTRGHSPILAPNNNLIWTTTKPSISYAFNLRDDGTTSLLPKSPEATDEKMEISGNSSPQSSEHRKKSKKSREREKIKKRRSSRKSCDLSSKRKIEKIRKSLEKPERAISSSHDGYAERRLSKKLKLDKSSEDSEEMWDEDELQELAHTFQLSKTNHTATKEDVTQAQRDLKAAEGNLTPEGPALPPQSTEHSDLTGLTKDFDMFADSPPSYDINNKVEADISGTERNSARGDNRGGTPPKKNYTKSSANTEHHSSNTPPKNLLKEASANSSEPTSSAEKTPLQKAIEIQTRIDKLLKEDDLDASFISKIKAKSLEHKRRKEQEAVSLKKHNEALTCKKPEPQRSLTPEPPKNLNNPFRRSKSRSRHIRRSHSRSPKRQLNINRSSFSNTRQHMRNAGFQNTSNSGTFNREKGRWKQSSRSPRGKRDGESVENPFKPSKHKEKNSTSKKNKSKAPLSFTAAEFLFPGGDDDSSLRKELSNDDSSSPRKNSTKKKSTNMQDKNDSPDTDDYMDNWENDDADLDVNSSNACDSSTPMRSSSQDDVEEQMFVARFVNPSPPLNLQQSLKASTETKLHQQKSVNLATEAADKAHTPPFDLITCKQQQQQPASPVVSKELFGMQEIYDQFIKSVEESGVDLKPNESCFENVEKSDESVTQKSTDDLYLGSSTSSSTSSSSTSSSSDSNSSTNSSSSSSSSTTASSSEDSNDVDESFANVTLDSPRPKPKIKDVKPVVINTEAERVTSITPPLPATLTVVKVEKDVIKSPESTTPPPIEALNEAKPAAISVLPPPSAVEPPQPTKPAPAPPAKAPKSDVAKDFKKLKSLEGNLARIQMMRANYDSTDEISEELLKMEKLFLQEKNLILQKYAKSSTASAEPKPVEPKSTEPAAKSQNSEGLQQAPPETTATAEAAAEAAKANKIFDANREAIKLTISPKRLPKTSAIFETIGTGDEKDSKQASLESDETDFTEKLKKPAKEVAIVKPMMETKDARHSSQQRSRRLSPVISRQGHESRPRSPNSGYQRDRRRSTSRSRLSPQRRQRGRSLSVSPRRTACGRYASPGRRGTGNSNSTIAHSRYRNSGRRSRSRSRSITRQGRRRGEFSPINMRSRRPAGSSSGPLTAYYRKSSQAQQRDRDSRSRSRSPPRSPPLRPHSPRSPPPIMMRRRSYSRDRYTSRSPLPFKPPSPPMRRSLSPHVQRGSSLSPTMRLSSSRRSPRSSRSRSRSRSPRYDDHRHRRDDSYDRRSPSQQQQYFMQEPPMDDHNASSYYYNLSPNRISLDARINIVLNGPANQESGGVVAPSYDSYSNYSQYTGQYLPFPPHPDAAGYSINYAGHQYVPMSVSSTHSGSSSSSYKPLYSNIPTIGGGEGMPPTPAAMHPNYYYGEFGNLVNDQHSSSVLKELPKATVAVQKGNVLEIVPTSEINSANGGRAMAGSGGGAQQASGKSAKPKKSVTVSWKEEVNNRHVAAAVMRLSRENDGSSKSILKKTSAFSDEAPQKEDSSIKPIKKKVYFEDGIYPNRDSGDEDRTIIEAKIQRKLRRLKKVHDIATDADKKMKHEDIKTDSDMEDIPPPPPPPGAPPAHLEQPIFVPPHSPPFWYSHYDPIMNFVYMAKCHQPLPPRLANVGPTAGTPTTTTQSPANTLSPNGGSTATNILGSRKDIPTFKRGSRSTDHSSPMLTLPSAPQRRDNLSTMKTMPIETIHTENSMAPHKNSFQPIPTNISSATILPQAPPHHISPMTCLPPGQQPCPPIGFMGMRINNYMRLPPSPLARPGPGFPTPGGPGMPLQMAMRHPFNMPPPAMMPPNGHGQLQQHPHLSPDFTPQQQQMQYHPHSGHLPNSPHMHHPSPYPVQPPSQHHHPIQFPHTLHPPPGVHTPPHVHHQRQPSPQFYVQSIPPPPLPTNRMGMAPMHGPSPDGTGADDANAQPNISLPAPMI